jgi:hypothetical protein
MGILKEGGKEDRIDIRTTKSLSDHEKAADYNICLAEPERRITCCGQLQ